MMLAQIQEVQSLIATVGLSGFLSVCMAIICIKVLSNRYPKVDDFFSSKARREKSIDLPAIHTPAMPHELLDMLRDITKALSSLPIITATLTNLTAVVERQTANVDKLIEGRRRDAWEIAKELEIRERVRSEMRQDQHGATVEREAAEDKEDRRKRR